MNITIAEVNLYDPVAMYGGGSLVFKRPNVMRVNNYYQRNPIDSDGESVNGVTSVGDGRVLISPHRMRTSLGFAKTYYHEGIHSLHAATGIFKAWKLRYGSDEASRITEFFAHSMTDGMSGVSMKFSPAFTSRYYPALYIQSLSSFLRP